LKKLLFVLTLAVIPMAVFADFRIGATAMYKGTPQALVSVVPNDVGAFAFGAEARLGISILEGQAMALYNFNRSFDTYLDVGIALDIAILTIGVGVGPNIAVNLIPSAPEAASFGFNGKAHVDLNLGKFTISGYYMIILDRLDMTNIQDNLTLGNVGLSVLLKLF